MTAKRALPRLKTNFTLGGEAAESDTLLERVFVDSGHFALAASKSDRRCFMIGRTGAGKSAILKHLADSAPEHVVRIDPENLSLPYIAELGAVRQLASLDVHLDPLFIALWKHVLLVEIIRHRYHVDSAASKQNIFSNLFERVKRDAGKRAALEYLDDFEGKFWAETDGRVREFTRKFEEQIDSAGGVQLTLGGLVAAGVAGKNVTTTNTEVKSSQVNIFQRIVNDSQLPRLNKMMEILDEDILESEQDFTYILIDNLDRDWVDEKIANDLIRCLFRTVVDLQKVRQLKVIVALRTNIFEELDFGRTGGQEEKFRALSVQVRWTREDLVTLLDQRAKAASEDYGIPSVTAIADLLPNVNRVRGNPLDFVFERTLLRPRDAIAFLNECFAQVSLKSKTRLTWEDIHRAESEYSRKRLWALRDEWKPTFPGIDEVFGQFQGHSAEMDREEFTRCLDEAALLVASHTFAGVVWMTALATNIWAGSHDATWVDQYQALVRLLFQIGFLGFARPGRSDPLYSYDDLGFADRPSNLEAVDRFVIHPAFRSALDSRVENRRPTQTNAGVDDL